MPKKQDHIHKFKRLKYKTGNTIFFCALPDCNQKMNISLALGKRSLCWRCNEPFIMTEYSLRLAKPHCENCHKPKNGILIEEPVAVANDSNRELSLAERLQQTLHHAEKESEDDI